jgi:beta-galactosidase
MPLVVRIAFGILSLFCLFCPRLAQANGEIFPADPAAQNAINWKDGYFSINGKPTFLTSGEMHYARIPRELWRDRIWRARQMGFNCMQMYVFWNATEGKENQWDFSDNLDLDAWLSMIQDAGMYAVIRVGPYSCAEWEHGGFPSWLTIKPGMTLRDHDPAFESYVDSHLAQVEKIVAQHQINHGGNVIMVQLENEHSSGWGTEDQDPYPQRTIRIQNPLPVS